MKKTLLFLLLLLSALLLYWHIGLHPAMPSAAAPAPAQEKTGTKILLVPLDSRPPCKDFVIDAGRIGGIEVVTPPTELLDYYSAPGNTEGERQWLMEHAGEAQAMILSVDQLLYGGLLTAREKTASPEAIAALTDDLRALHAAHPEVPIYAFSILPRMNPQDSIDGLQERKDLMRYSRLVGKRAAGLSLDAAEQSEREALLQRIPADSMQKYLAHFEENEALNKALAALVKAGTLHMLVLGQDDGEPYSIPNIEKAHIQTYLTEQGLAEPQVYVVHGADELALDLLARIDNDANGRTPHIALETGSPEMADRVMPYMAVSCETAAEEKIRLIGGTRVSPADGQTPDVTLFLSAIDLEKDLFDTRRASAARIEQGVKKGEALALVDLSKHFSENETLLPFLQDSDAPLPKLAAYAGWNTTSNAVGTALAEASLYLGHFPAAADDTQAMAIYRTQLTFLCNRMVEDTFYLKDSIDTVNDNLKKAGWQNTADLDLEKNYRTANAMMHQALTSRVETFQSAPAISAPFSLTLPGGQKRCTLKKLPFEASYPWPRTFEIRLETHPYLEGSQDKANDSPLLTITTILRRVCCC